MEEEVWKTIQLFSRYTFTTKKGEKFRYTVNVAVSMVIDKGKLSETEWLRLYGGIYLEAIFERMGIGNWCV